jgi:hypothetical protein
MRQAKRWSHRIPPAHVEEARGMLVRLLVYTHRWLGIALGALFAG